MKETLKKDNRRSLREKYLLPASKLPPGKPIADFRETAQWRVFRIMAEFVEGFNFLADMKRSVTFFGSARTKPDDSHYQQARTLGYLLAKGGYEVITGGGPGVMEAANRGALEAGGASIGFNIQLPQEQRVNDYVNKSIAFHYFFTRKLMLSYSAQAYVFFPGGMGTLDEFFEIITLIQTKKIEKITVIAVGKDFWSPLYHFLKETVHKRHGAIDQEDMWLFHIVDTAEEAFKIIKKSKPRKIVL